MAETDEQAEQVRGRGPQAGRAAEDAARGQAASSTIAIRGDVEFDWANEQDHVIQRADGTCLYHLASVVDDYDFKITHVIRAEEHLSNTPRQIFIAQSLGYPLPEYAHLPYVAEPGSKNKLTQAENRQVSEEPRFQALYDHGAAIAARIGHVAGGRDVQSGDRRFLPRSRLSARRDHQLPGAAGLVARRQDRGFFSRAR